MSAVRPFEFDSGGRFTALVTDRIPPAAMPSERLVSSLQSVDSESAILDHLAALDRLSAS